MRNRNGWISLNTLILILPLFLCETLLRKSVVTEWDFFSLNHTPLSLSLAAPRGPEYRWWFFFIISPPVWFQIHLSTFFWRFEALILPAVTKIFLSFEKWVIMNWWVMFAVTFENYSFFFGGEWVKFLILIFCLNWYLKACSKGFTIYIYWLLLNHYKFIILTKHLKFCMTYFSNLKKNTISN